MERDSSLPLTPADIAWARAKGKPLPEDDGGDVLAIVNRDWKQRMERIRNPGMPAQGWANFGGVATSRHTQQYLESIEARLGVDRLDEMRNKLGEDGTNSLGMPYLEQDVDYLRDLAERIFFGISLDGGDVDRLNEIASDGKLAKRKLD